MSELPVLELDARFSKRTALPLVNLASRELDLLVFVGCILIRVRIELILAVYRLVRYRLVRRVGKLDVYQKCRGIKNARKAMIDAIKNGGMCSPLRSAKNRC